MNEDQRDPRHGLTPEQEIRARDRAADLANVLAGWICAERTLGAGGVGFRAKLEASRDLVRLHGEAERLVNEIVA